MKQTNNQSDSTPSGCNQIVGALIFIVFGLAFASIPLFLGMNVVSNVRGNRGPGGAGAIIVGAFCVLFGLGRLCVIFVKGLTGRLK